MKHESATSAVATSAPIALVERAALESALAFVSRVVERRNHIPILSNARLRARDGGLRIETTDMDMTAVANIPAAVDSRLDLTVPARLLHDTLKGAACDLCEVRQSSETVALDLEGAAATLNALPATDFPEPAIAGFTHTFTIRADLLRRLLDKTAFAISSEETRFYLKGVFLHVSPHDGSLVCVATDGHRLARSLASCPEGAKGMPGVIVPRKAVAELLRLVPKGTKAKPSREPITVSVCSSRVRFQVGDSWLDTKTIDGHFPDYQRVIPTGNDKRLRIDREPFMAAIKAVLAVSSEKSRAVKLNITDGFLEVSRSDPDKGRSSRLVEADFPHSDMEIGFNGRYLLDILAKIESEAAIIELADFGSPTLFSNECDGSELFVCMPLRV
jgi:DNA polymerase III subunit beta